MIVWNYSWTGRRGLFMYFLLHSWPPPRIKYLGSVLTLVVKRLQAIYNVYTRKQVDNRLLELRCRTVEKALSCYDRRRLMTPSLLKLK